MIEKYRPLFIHLNPASIPEVVAHIQKYLTENEFVTVDDFGQQFQEYIDAHPDIIKVGSVNGLTGDVLLTSENITMTGESSDTIGAVIGDILEEASATGETVDDLVVDMDAVKSDIVTLENVFTGATASTNGAKGLVPAPVSANEYMFLRGNGMFDTVHARNVASEVITGAGSVETALANLKQRLDDINNFVVYTEPQSVADNISINTFQCFHFPNKKTVQLDLNINLNATFATGATIMTLSTAVPKPSYRKLFILTSQSGALFSASLNPDGTIWIIAPPNGAVSFALGSVIYDYEY